MKIELEFEQEVTNYLKLDIEENQLFCQKVFAFLQSREHKIQIHGEHYRENRIFL